MSRANYNGIVTVGSQDVGDGYDADDLESIGRVFLAGAAAMRQRKEGRITTPYGSSPKSDLAWVYIEGPRDRAVADNDDGKSYIEETRKWVIQRVARLKAPRRGRQRVYIAVEALSPDAVRNVLKKHFGKNAKDWEVISR